MSPVQTPTRSVALETPAARAEMFVESSGTSIINVLVRLLDLCRPQEEPVAAAAYEMPTVGGLHKQE
jgi:hypothetical protein